MYFPYLPVEELTQPGEGNMKMMKTVMVMRGQRGWLLLLYIIFLLRNTELQYTLANPVCEEQLGREEQLRGNNANFFRLGYSWRLNLRKIWIFFHLKQDFLHLKQDFLHLKKDFLPSQARFPPS